MVNPLPVPAITVLIQHVQVLRVIIYATEPGMTGYAWTVSAGGIITNGSGTNEIAITWISRRPQIISVMYTEYKRLCRLLHGQL